MFICLWTVKGPFSLFLENIIIATENIWPLYLRQLLSIYSLNEFANTCFEQLKAIIFTGIVKDKLI